MSSSTDSSGDVVGIHLYPSAVADFQNVRELSAKFLPIPLLFKHRERLFQKSLTVMNHNNAPFCKPQQGAALENPKSFAMKTRSIENNR